MPVALLLHQVLGPLLDDRRRALPFATLALDRARRGLARLEPLGRLAVLEETLLDRARGAFLVHWFGSRLPTEGLAVRVSIANLEALRRRYRAAVLATSPEDRGLNLTEPLMGLMGMAAGILLSPSGLFALTVSARRGLNRVVSLLLTVLLWGVWPAVGLLVGVLAAPAGVGVAVLAAARDEQPVRGVYDLMGTLARLLQQAGLFFDQLLGPRERVLNPLVKQLLGIADGLARLVPSILVLVSLVVERVGPLMPTLARQGAALMDLGRALKHVLLEVKQELAAIPKVLKGLFSRAPDAPLGRLSQVFANLGTTLGQVTPGFGTVLDHAAGRLRDLGERLLQALEGFQDAVRDALPHVLQQHPLGFVLALLRDQLREVGTLFSSQATASTSWPQLPGWLTSGLAHFGAAPPPVPTLPTLPDLEAIEAGLRQPEFPLTQAGILAAAAKVPIPAGFARRFLPSEEARKQLDAAAGAPSLFARARRELARQAGATPAEALARMRAEELPLREALATVIERVMPSSAREYLPTLLELFQQLDEQLYAGAAHPVRQVPESRRLRVVVHRLHLRAAGGDGPHVAAFRERLLQTLQRQDYLAPATP